MTDDMNQPEVEPAEHIRPHFDGDKVCACRCIRCLFIEDNGEDSCVCVYCCGREVPRHG